MEGKLARFDTRWTEEQKALFERASALGGFRTLSEFVLFAVRRQAEEILERDAQILASQRDREIFMNALLSPPEPNAKLKMAASRYFDLFTGGNDENRAAEQRP